MFITDSSTNVHTTFHTFPVHSKCPAYPPLSFILYCNSIRHAGAPELAPRPDGVSSPILLVYYRFTWIYNRLITNHFKILFQWVINAFQLQSLGR